MSVNNCMMNVNINILVLYDAGLKPPELPDILYNMALHISYK